jgi:hypothetical protein
VSQLYIAVAIFLAGLGFGGAGAWKVQAWRHDSAELQRVSQEGHDVLRRQEVAIDQSAKFQAGQASAAEREPAVIQEVIRVVSKPVYLERCLDDDGLRIIAADIQAANARRGLATALPASAAAR